MSIYDDKTTKVIHSGKFYIIDSIKHDSEIVFKSSFLVASDLTADGKIVALFDLIVLGNVEAQDIDVKGKLICLGNCNVTNSIVVQDKLFAQGLRAKNIEVHDDVIAQEIDVDSLTVDGNVIVGQTLAVAETAKSNQKIMCGETAYGAGKIFAFQIITGEALDLDEGINAVAGINRMILSHEKETTATNVTSANKFAQRNDYNSYFAELINNDRENLNKATFERWKKTIANVKEIIKQSNFICYDIGVLLSIMEMAQSSYFVNWKEVGQLQQLLLDRFNRIVNGEVVVSSNSIILDRLDLNQRVKHKQYGCGIIKAIDKKGDYPATVRFDNGRTINFLMKMAEKFFSLERNSSLSTEELIGQLHISLADYDEWLAYLHVLRVCGNMLSPKLYSISFDLLYAKMGLRAKFISDRLKANGWKDHV